MTDRLPAGFALDDEPPPGFTVDTPPTRGQKFMSGVNRTYAALAGLPVDLMNALISYQAEGTNYPALPRAESPVGGGQQVAGLLGAAGIDLNQPRDVWGMAGEYLAPTPLAGAYNAVAAPLRGPFARQATKVLGPTVGPVVGHTAREGVAATAALGGGMAGQQIGEKLGSDSPMWEMAGAIVPAAIASGASGVPRWLAGVDDPTKMRSRIAELDAQGLPLTVGLATDNPVAKAREAKLAASPGGYEVLRATGRQADAAFDATQQRIVGGASDSVDAAGSKMKDGGSVAGGGLLGKDGWYSRFNAKAKELYTQLDSKVGGRTPVVAANTQQWFDKYQSLDPMAPSLSAGEKNPVIAGFARDFLSDTMGEGVSVASGAAVKVPGATSGVDPLMNRIPGGPAQTIPTATVVGKQRAWDSLTNTPPAPAPIPYERLKRLRTRVGDALEITDTTVLGSSDREALKGLYRALSQDMEAIAAKNGASKEFTKANRFYHQGADRAEIWLDNLNKKVKPEDFWKATVGDNPQSATQLRAYKQMLKPDEWDYMVETVSNRWGKTAPNQETIGHQFQLNRWYTNWNKTPGEVKDVLFGKTGTPKRDAAELMAKNLDKFREQTQVLFNSSGSASTGLAASAQYGAIGGAGTAVLGYLTGVVDTLPELASSMAVGTMGGVAVATSGSAGLARLTTNPNFVKWLAKGMEMPKERLPGHLMRLASIAKNDPELQEPAKELIRGLDPALYGRLYGAQ